MDIPLGVDEEMPILKKTKASTGVKDLDLILEGGYQNPGNIMLTGPAGIEKMAFAFHFADSSEDKENVYFICGDTSPKELIKKASTMGIKLDKPNIFFIDCYTATLSSEKKLEKTEKITMIGGPGALNDISLELNEAINKSKGKRMRVIFQTLSTFVLYNAQDSMRKFLGVIKGRLKNANATTLYLVEEDVHDKHVLSLLEQGMDEIYTLTEKGGKFELQVPGSTMPVPLKLGPAGITIQ